MTDSPFKIYNASAGSGKTHTLTKAYLKIILASPKNLGNILALTFTNKAVGEMKHRILDSLYQFGQTTDMAAANPLFISLLDELALDVETLRKKAKQTLKEILHNYAFFDISTLDKFTHRLIRTFAKDLKLPQNFEVILEKDMLLDEAVSRLILKAGNDPLLTKVLIDFALEKIEDERSWDIAFDLHKIGALLFEENQVEHLEKLKDKSIVDFLELQKSLQVKIKYCEDKIASEAKQIIMLFDQNGLQETDFTSGYFPKFIQKIDGGDLNLDYKAAWKQNFGEKPLYNKSCDPGTMQIIDGLQQAFTKSFGLIKEAYHQLSFLNNAYGNIVPLTVLNSLQLEIKKLQEEKDQLSIAEFNTIISREIKNQPAPFIYERLGEKYRHYFVDEFQDTSSMQWSNLQPLIGNALSSVDHMGETGSLFLVGDAKQAIYRWRGGRAEQLLDLILERSNPFVLAPDIYKLETNYRSHEEVINFNNAFFQTTAPFLNNEIYHQLFIEGNDQYTNAKKGGYVQLTFIDRLEEEADKDSLYGAAVVKTIEAVLRHGHAPRDVCILVRGNKEGVALADFLTQQGIPVVSSESLLLNSSEKVRFLADLLRYQNQPNDLATKYDILLFLSKKVASRHAFIAEHLADPGALLSGQYGYDPILLKQKSVYDGLELAIKQFDLARDTDAYILFFMDFVLDLEQREGPGLQIFLEYWDKKKERLGLSTSASLEAIQIMTVHKAKGLEFPIVIYPYANEHIYKRMDKKMWLPVNQEDYVGFEELLLNEKQEVVNYSEQADLYYHIEEHKMELDAFNLLYVALTRAEKALFIITEKQLDKKGSHNTDYFSGLFIHFLKEKKLWEDTLDSYHFGAIPSCIPEPTSQQYNIAYQYTYKERPSFRILTTTGALWGTEKEKALAKGNLVHAAMGMIETYADLEKALAMIVMNGDCSQDEVGALRTAILQIMEHPQLVTYFDAGNVVMNEQDIITNNGRILRPDRIVINDKSVTVIDYKTGKKDTKYEVQLNTYGEALHQMGYCVKNKIIVYIDEYILPEFI